MRKSFKNSEQGKFKPDVSHFLPTSPVSVATLDFSSASVPVDYWIAGAVFSMAITPGIMKPKLGMSKTELTPTLPLSCPQLLPLWTSSLLSKLSSFSRRTSSKPQREPCQLLPPSQIQPVSSLPSRFLFYNAFHTCPLSLSLFSTSAHPLQTCLRAQWLRHEFQVQTPRFCCQFQCLLAE